MKRKILSLLLSSVLVASVLSGCSGGEKEGGKKTDNKVEQGSKSTDEKVTLEFAQWWETELPDGKFRALMDKFEEKNPDIKVELLSGPYASTKEQVVAGAAAKTMADVVGLDGAWVHDFAKQEAIANLSTLMKESGYDESQLASQIQVDNGTYMIPVVNFVYPVFVNEELLEGAGMNKAPETRSEFAEAAKAITNAQNNTYGWILPLSLESPNGIQNDVMSWVWASGKSMLKDGKPDVANSDVQEAVEYIKELYDGGTIAPGAFSMKEQDKVEEFTNGRIGMMIDSLAHINTIRESNPNLKFSLTALPAQDGYAGKRGMPYASWGIGIAENSKHKEEAFRLVEFLMSEEVNSELSTMANAFPGNVKSVPDFADSDELFEEAFEIYKAGYPANEFVGLPVAEDLMRDFDEQFQQMLEGDQSVKEMLEKVQGIWLPKFE